MLMRSLRIKVDCLFLLSIQSKEIINSVMPEEMHQIVSENQDQFEDFEFE